MSIYDPAAEWLEADGLGGFASGTVSGIRTRRYHALLLHAETPPTGRRVLVNGFDAWVESPSGKYALTSQRYGPDVIHPDGSKRLESFHPDPWPRWSFLLEDGARIEQELFVVHGKSIVILSWKMQGQQNGARLRVRPFFSDRDYHSLHHENHSFNFVPEITGNRLTWRPYSGTPPIVSFSNGRFIQDAAWNRNFLYSEEKARGLDDTEDLASPGSFEWNFADGPAFLAFTTEEKMDVSSISNFVEDFRSKELSRRKAFGGTLECSADAYIVKRGGGKTIIAGYPWFADWGRDTFIALRGLLLATNRLDDARDILLEWAGAVSEGMLPNRFPDQGTEPEFNSVDASLWYIIAVHDYLKKAAASPSDNRSLQAAVDSILEGYSKGTRYNIKADTDGLLAAGITGQQLTWMDAKIGDWVVTPRIGKPVEIQALWLNSLWIASGWSPRWKPMLNSGQSSFERRFWNEDRRMLYDVVDANHISGAVDASFRPNQIFAIGGLPFQLISGERAVSIVDRVEKRLLTPTGLRSLARSEPEYVAHYGGGVRERDGSYHQGTVWPWLIGGFVEAWVRVRGNTEDAKKEARSRFVDPLLAHLNEAGINHISEITDAETPFTPRGCPFQAWSAGEVLRLLHDVLQ